MIRTAAVASLAAAAALAAGCGSSSKTNTASIPAGGTEGSTSPAQSAGGSPTDLSHKPAIQKPSGQPPKKLVVHDLVVGHGAVATKGKNVTVQYVGVSWSTGQQFDASWDRGQPFTFQIGGGQVIPGWEKGVVGMHVGGRRQLIIPPDLGYGPQGSPPAIAPNETLIFDIDLLKVQ